MTVSTTIDRVSLVANGSTTTFNFPFPAVDPSFIQVSVTNSSNVTTPLSPSGFNVVLNPPVDPNPTSVGGTVTILGPPLAVGNTVNIIRVLPLTQSVSLSDQSIVYPAVVEQEFDYLTMMRQTSSTDISRCFQVPPTDPPPALVPAATVRANQFAFFDSSGNLTSGGLPTGGVTISAAMIPVVGAATLPLAQVAMGVAPTVSPAFTGTPTAPTPAPGDNDTSVATTAFVQALVAATVGAAVFTTGDLKPTHKVTADSGWIMWVDGSVGDATSGASIRANADTQALFTLYYNSYSDSNCPLLTSTGTGTTRALQGTAATAFAAHCRVSLPKGAGRALALSGTGAGLTSRTLGSIFGSETHTLLVGELPGGVATYSGFITTGGFAASGDPSNLGFCNLIGGGSSPMPIMDPTTYINIMVKL